MKRYCLWLVLLLASCDSSPRDANANKKMTVVDGFEIVTIDGCEYIQLGRGSMIIHKANCKNLNHICSQAPKGSQ